MPCGCRNKSKDTGTGRNNDVVVLGRDSHISRATASGFITFDSNDRGGGQIDTSWHDRRFNMMNRDSDSAVDLDSLACRFCYLKHVSKAYVELMEYIEDTSRVAEMALAIGDIGCAEDHARALSLTTAPELREIRRQIPDEPSASLERLRVFMERAAKSVHMDDKAKFNDKKDSVR